MLVGKFCASFLLQLCLVLVPATLLTTTNDVAVAPVAEQALYVRSVLDCLQVEVEVVLFPSAFLALSTGERLVVRLYVAGPRRFAQDCVAMRTRQLRFTKTAFLASDEAGASVTRILHRLF